MSRCPICHSDSYNPVEAIVDNKVLKYKMCFHCEYEGEVNVTTTSRFSTTIKACKELFKQFRATVRGCRKYLKGSF